MEAKNLLYGRRRSQSSPERKRLAKAARRKQLRQQKRNNLRIEFELAKSDLAQGDSWRLAELMESEIEYGLGADFKRELRLTLNHTIDLALAAGDPHSSVKLLEEGDDMVGLIEMFKRAHELSLPASIVHQGAIALSQYGHLLANRKLLEDLGASRHLIGPLPRTILGRDMYYHYTFQGEIACGGEINKHFAGLASALQFTVDCPQCKGRENIDILAPDPWFNLLKSSDLSDLTERPFSPVERSLVGSDIIRDYLLLGRTEINQRLKDYTSQRI